MSKRTVELIASLNLQAHPEGGHYQEVFRSSQRVQRRGADRAALTTIFYLLRQGEISRWHVVDSDEAWHFYEGDGLELITYDPGTGEKATRRLGPPSDHSVPVHVVAAGVGQAARPLGDYGLAGCSVGPGFEFADFRLVRDLPEHRAVFDGPLRGWELFL